MCGTRFFFFLPLNLGPSTNDNGGDESNYIVCTRTHEARRNEEKEMNRRGRVGRRIGWFSKIGLSVIQSNVIGHFNWCRRYVYGNYFCLFVCIIQPAAGAVFPRFADCRLKIDTALWGWRAEPVSLHPSNIHPTD
jgi:hypothetical protein